MKKRLLCAFLCLNLCLGFARGAGDSFPDVKDTDWFAPYVKVCVDAGLMNGTGDGGFSPADTITVAQVAAIAARLGEQLNSKPIVEGTPAPGETLPWYHWYVEYLKGYGLTLTRLEEQATRQEFFTLLSAVTPAASLAPINSITQLPDTQDKSVLAFYNAGVLTGTDEYGTFSPGRGLTRSEAAAMLARIVKPELRQSFTPREKPQGEADVELNTKVALVINGQEMTVGEFASWLVQVAYYWDSYYYNNFNTRLPWDEETESILLTQAKNQAVAYVTMSAQAAQLGCSIQDLAAVLTPSPTREQLAAYVAQEGLLRAKHILVTDEVSAQSIIDALNAQPTQAQFDNILSLLGTDPGMASNPDGYLFVPGEMVEEFEAGTKALEIGAYSSQPVPSSFGFHVILRLDPLDHPELPAMYQEDRMNDLVDQWIAQASVQVDELVMSEIDIQSTYEFYLQSLSQNGT